LSALLLIADDNILLDYLGQVFETRDLDVVIATTLRAGLEHLGARKFDVVVSGWAVAGGSSGALYRQAVAREPGLRHQFVFLAADPPSDLEQVIEGRTACVDPWDVEELIRLVEAGARRAQEQAGLSDKQRSWLAGDRPELLLVEDGALELMAMVRVLDDFGFEVTPADCGNAAIAQLESRDFHVILSDWYMDDGSGAELYQWIAEHRPAMKQRVVFMSGAAPREAATVAPGRPLISKGQDSPQLVETLMRVARGG
jgi:DNA-binding NtrC family response regulator